MSHLKLGHPTLKLVIQDFITVKGKEGLAGNHLAKPSFSTLGRAWTFGPTGKGQKGSDVVRQKGAVFSVTEKGLLENPCYTRDF